MTVTWQASDALSGLVGAAPTPSTVTGEGANLSATTSVSDVAGNDRTTTVSGIKIDRSKPTTTAQVAKAPESGWYQSGPEVTLTGSDNLSGTTTYYTINGGDKQTYSAPFTVSTPGTNTVVFWSVDGAGNIEDAPAPLILKVDSAAPSTTVKLPPAADTGWYIESGLPVAFQATDNTNGSGIAATYYSINTIDNGAVQTYGEPFIQSLPDGENKITFWSVDIAGNVEAKETVTQTVTVSVDTLAPAVTPADVNDTTWRATALSQEFTSSDGTSGSGLANPTADAKFTLQASAESTKNADGAVVATTDSRTVKDVAGNATTRKLSALIDVTKPTIIGDDQVSTTWRNTPLSGTFKASDALSGLNKADDASFTLTASADSASATAPTVVTRTVKDNAGNERTATVSALIDTAAPTSVSFVNGPAADTRYYTNTVPAAPTCTATDSLSSFDSCTVTGYSTAEGTHTLTATAKDTAGNQATATRSYTVKNLTRTGFYAPVNMDGVYNTIKGGNTVPLKFEVFDGTQELRDKAVVQGFTAAKISCTTGIEDAVEVFTSTGQTELRYDTTADQFIQNWKTPTGSGCYKATMTTVDGQSISALFKTLK